MAQYVHMHDGEPIVYEDECPVCVTLAKEINEGSGNGTN